ncbi:L,D-transpeptidase [Streptomyces hoynatensis]|uniref:L,D-transpeptidase n=1 Tax=Streptomyces hoynatensis TaxID=1141874 RepID=UPI0026B0297E
MRTRPRRAWIPAATAVLFGALLLGTAGCSGSSEANEPPAGEGATAEQAEPVHISVAPGDGATGVATSGELQVTAQDGTLTEVTVADADGAEVPGELTEDGAGWAPTEHLANDTAYTVTATGKNSEGAEETVSSHFTTVAADATFTTNWNIPDGAEVGVGMELSLTFDAAIENPDEVRDAVQITTEPEVEVAGHWFGSNRLDFRPEEYWAPGTEVTVRLRERGVEGAPGVYGTAYEDLHFTIGRSQVSTVDVAAHTMDVVRDGERVKTIPITAGAPGRDTWLGRMVITERLVETRMDGETVGYGGEYDIPDVPHAMRLTNSGTFIHGNYWAASSVFGSENSSHGCIGLDDTRGASDESTDAYWFYEHSMIGDVVEVVNSDDEVVAPDNGLTGWNMSWSDWTAEQ